MDKDTRLQLLSSTCIGTQVHEHIRSRTHLHTAHMYTLHGYMHEQTFWFISQAWIFHLLKFLWKFMADLYAWKAAFMTLCFDNFPLNLSTGTFWPRERETDFCKLEPKELASNLEFYTYPERQRQGSALSILRKEPQVLAFESLPDVSERRLEDWLALLSASLFSPLINHCLFLLPTPLHAIHTPK